MLNGFKRDDHIHTLPRKTELRSIASRKMVQPVTRSGAGERGPAQIQAEASAGSCPAQIVSPDAASGSDIQHDASGDKLRRESVPHLSLAEGYLRGGAGHNSFSGIFQLRSRCCIHERLNFMRPEFCYNPEFHQPA
jgi:hypothetical protein